MKLIGKPSVSDRVLRLRNLALKAPRPGIRVPRLGNLALETPRPEMSHFMKGSSKEMIGF